MTWFVPIGGKTAHWFETKSTASTAYRAFCGVAGSIVGRPIGNTPKCRKCTRSLDKQRKGNG